MLESKTAALVQSPPLVYSDYPIVPVPVVSGISAADLRDGYLSGLGRPVVVRDVVPAWPAMRKWSFQFFADRYGSRPHLTNTNLNRTIGWKRMRFDDYLLYCQCPALSPLGKLKTDGVYYSAFPLIQLFPELVDDLPPAKCVDNIYCQLQGKLHDWYQQTFVWVFIGPAGTITDFHIDHFMTHTYSAQLIGRKRYLFFSPACIANIPGPSARKAEHDLTRKGGYTYDETPIAHEAVLGPGEMVVFPAGWAHHVESLEPSISISVNFVDSTNYLEHLMSISTHLPQWGSRIDGSFFRQGAQCTWTGRDFEMLGREARA